MVLALRFGSLFNAKTKGVEEENNLRNSEMLFPSKDEVLWMHATMKFGRI